MPTDRFGLALSTPSAAAAEAYGQGCELLLTAYPGAAEALERATEADPGFALAHAARARVAQMEGDTATAKAAIAAATALADGLPAREASHVNVFALLLSGRPEAALSALRDHLAEHPRDAMVLSTACTPSGLIGMSGRAEQKYEQVALLDDLAGAYGEDWWFDAHYAQALAEAHRQTEALPRIRRSVEQRRANAWAAHWHAHVCYETGDAEASRAFIRDWLPGYDRRGQLHGHIAWHLALVEIATGNQPEAERLFAANAAPGMHSGPAQSRVADAVSFLWRSELAGAPRDPARWARTRDLALSLFPNPGNPFADAHVVLAQAVTGDTEALDQRVRQIEDLTKDGRYPSGPVVPALARGFTAFLRQDYDAAIDTLAPVLDQRARIGGSRAQTDLIEFTLLQAYASADRLAEMRDLLAQRRPGPGAVPVASVH
jgi:hypothetical protein